MWFGVMGHLSAPLMTLNNSTRAASTPSLTFTGLTLSLILNKSFDICHTDHLWWFTLTKNTWHPTTNVVFSFGNTCRAALKDKKYRRRNCNTVPSTRPSVVAAATMPACPASALSVMNMPTVSLDQTFLDLHFTKPSYDTCLKMSLVEKLKVRHTLLLLSHNTN